LILSVAVAFCIIQPPKPGKALGAVKKYDNVISKKC
jgi:hypothetical protein